MKATFKGEKYNNYSRIQEWFSNGSMVDFMFDLNDIAAIYPERKI